MLRFLNYIHASNTTKSLTITIIIMNKSTSNLRKWKTLKR